MNNIHVKRGDTVIVLAGKDKGKIGKILVANPSSHRVQVENVNIITRHKKAKSAQESGGRINDAGFIDSSNVMVVCPSCSKPTRIAHKFLDDKKFRACKHCSASLDEQKLDKKSKKPKKEVAKKADATKASKSKVDKLEDSKEVKKDTTKKESASKVENKPTKEKVQKSSAKPK